MSAPRPQPSRSDPTHILVRLWDTLEHIRTEIGAMAETLERIEEIAREERDRERKYGFKYTDGPDDVHEGMQ